MTTGWPLTAPASGRKRRVKLPGLGVVVWNAPVEKRCQVSMTMSPKVSPASRTHATISSGATRLSETRTSPPRIARSIVEDEACDHKAHPEIVGVLRSGEGDAALFHLPPDQFAAPGGYSERQQDEERRLALAGPSRERVEAAFAHEARYGVGGRTKLPCRSPARVRKLGFGRSSPPPGDGALRSDSSALLRLAAGGNCSTPNRASMSSGLTLRSMGHALFSASLRSYPTAFARRMRTSRPAVPHRASTSRAARSPAPFAS